MSSAGSTDVHKDGIDDFHEHLNRQNADCADAGLEFIPSFFLNFHKDVSAGLSRLVGVTICDSLLSILKDYFFSFMLTNSQELKCRKCSS